MGDREALKTIQQALSVSEGFTMNEVLLDKGLHPSHFKTALKVAVKALQEFANKDKK